METTTTKDRLMLKHFAVERLNYVNFTQVLSLHHKTINYFKVNKQKINDVKGHFFKHCYVGMSPWNIKSD